MKRRPVDQVLADLERLRTEIERIGETLPVGTSEEDEEEALKAYYKRETSLISELPEEEVERLYPGDAQEGILGVRGLAKWFGVSTRTIFRWRTEEGFPSQGACGRWDAQAVARWLDYERVPVPERWRWRGDRPPRP